MKNICLAIAIGYTLLASNVALSRDQISIVGSSTVYPFTTVVAENFGLATDFKTPKVEATGTGGGIKLFCDGIGFHTPDMTNASRKIKTSEIEKCKKNGVKNIIEIQIGYDGIIFAQAKSTKPSKLTLREIYLALVKDVPNPDGSKNFVPNPYKQWSDIGKHLPAIEIKVFGPPPTSGTRDALVEVGLEKACQTFPWIKALQKTDKKAYKARCHAIREDGAYIEVGENDNLIVQKLVLNKDTYGIFGYSFLDQNMNKIQGAWVEGFEPSFENISNGQYPVSRPLYFYVKKAHVGLVPGMKSFIKEFISEQASGDEGYLADTGLIPLSSSNRVQRTKKIDKEI
ncbi:MAG: substrate-binding domain-containing protein [Candidatus Oxydemutatoraceae bacterium WSBS_2016_MAG_OTU14]